MTHDEAIEVLENGGWWDLLIPVTTIEGRIEDDKLHEALDLAIAALRPVSREQVEKMRGGVVLGATTRAKGPKTGSVHFWMTEVFQLLLETKWSGQMLSFALCAGSL